MDLATPPPDLYGRPRPDRFIQRLTAFGDWYPRAMGGPLMRRRPGRPAPRPTPMLQLTVVRHETIATDVVELLLADPSGGRLPAWQPGARLLLTLPSGRERHYSLCGDPADLGTYRIAVRRIADGGGGSVEIHDELHVGARLTARRPRNGFAFCGEPAVLLLAGGIGITPLLPMAREAHRRGLDWRLVHTGRTPDSMPFTDELRALDPARVVLLPDDPGRPRTSHAREELRAAEGTAPSPPVSRTSPRPSGEPLSATELLAYAPEGAAVYCCGPQPMLAAVQAAIDGSPARALHFERFGAAPILDGRPFTVRLGAEGPELVVPADRSALDVVREIRPELPYSCHQGFCGTCRVRLLSGSPEHRDRRLTEEDRAAGALLPCVSRAAEGETLVLDL